MEKQKRRLVHITTVPVSLKVLLKGQHRFMSENGYEVIGVSSKGKELEEIKEAEGIRVVPLQMSRKIAPLNDLKSLWRLYKLLKKERPAIVHSLTPKAGLLTMLAGKMAGIPIRIHTFTGLVFPTRTGLMQKLLIKMDKLLCWAATNVYPEGNGVRNDLINYKITSKPLKVLANGNVNGIDLEYFDLTQISVFQRAKLKQSLGIEPGDFIFVFVGRMVGDKGINELIAAFQSLIRNQKPETRNQKPGTWNLKPETWNLKPKTQNPKPETSIPKLLLVGAFESELDPLSPETLQEIESNPNIVHAGFQPDVRPYFAIANALVFPSYREGFPNVVMQAGAMELPSIVSNINGCNEIIIEGKNGTIIPPKDTEALCHAMKKMMSDKDYYNSLKENARRMIVERYEQRAVWEAILAEYKSLEENNLS